VVKVDSSSDSQLIAEAQSGSEKSLSLLVKRYGPLLGHRAKAFHVVGAEKDDVFQECLIGFYKAIRDYETGHDFSFRKFAKLCIDRQVIKAIKTAGRLKRKPLHQYEPIAKIAPSLICYESDPLRGTIIKERLQRLSAIFEDFSLVEKRVFSLFNQGCSYRDIASRTRLSSKSVDNALHRARQKLRAALNDD